MIQAICQMALIETLSVLTGIGGLGFGAYQYYRARNDRKRKDELNRLADNLDELRADIEIIVEVYESPTSKPDLSYQLGYCAKDILAYKFETGEPARVKSSIKKYNNENKEGISDTRQVINMFKHSEDIPYSSLTLESGHSGYESDLLYGISEHLHAVRRIYKIYDDLKTEYKGILEEFSPGLVNSIEDLVDEFVENFYSRILDTRGGVEIDPDAHNSVSEISEFIFQYFCHYNGVYADLQNLSQLADRVEETRTMILQASY